MNDFKVGDIVVRKSYGNDVRFAIANVLYRQDGSPVYILKGLSERLEADSDGDDLVKLDSKDIHNKIQNITSRAGRYTNIRRTPFALFRPYLMRRRAGSVLHIDSSGELFEVCYRHYRNLGLQVASKIAPESEQPQYVRKLLEKYNPNILVVTGHDSMKKGSRPNSIDSYRNSKYYIQSVREARSYQASYDKLCIFAGACQSYYEAIMAEGANFASSPGRILINGLDPAIVAERVALTETRKTVTPGQIAELTKSGSKGIWGIETRGHLIIM